MARRSTARWNYREGRKQVIRYLSSISNEKAANVVINQIALLSTQAPLILTRRSQCLSIWGLLRGVWERDVQPTPTMLAAMSAILEGDYVQPRLAATAAYIVANSDSSTRDQVATTISDLWLMMAVSDRLGDFARDAAASSSPSTSSSKTDTTPESTHAGHRKNRPGKPAVSVAGGLPRTERGGPASRPSVRPPSVDAVPSRSIDLGDEGDGDGGSPQIIRPFVSPDGGGTSKDLLRSHVLPVGSVEAKSSLP